MRRRALLAALAAILSVAAVAVAVALAVSGGDAPAVPPSADAAVELRTSVTPARLFFGDVATAVVELAIDVRRVDPAKIEIGAVFRPFYRAGNVTVERAELGDRLVVRYRYPLQCVVRACAPGPTGRLLQLPIGLVRYAPREGDVVSLPLEFPPVEIVTRLTEEDVRAIQFAPSELSADQALDSVPRPEARAGDRLIGWLLVGGACAIVLGIGGSLAMRLWPRAETEMPVESRASRPPLDVALDAVLASLEEGEERRRAALAGLARQLAKTGDDELGREARRLAWSRSGPELDRIRNLLARVGSRRGRSVEAG